MSEFTGGRLAGGLPGIILILNPIRLGLDIVYYIHYMLRHANGICTPCMNPDLITLYRPVGPAELRLIAARGFRAFPARLPEQPFFYPVMNEEYARQIARDWNVPASGAGFVTRFAVRKQFLAGYPEQQVGGALHKELWIPAGELEAMNRNIVGLIEVIAEYRGADSSESAALTSRERKP